VTGVRAPIAAAALCLVVAAAHAGLAQALAADLSVAKGPGAEDCPDRSALGEAIEAILKRPIAVPAGAGETLRVEVLFSRQGDRYLAALRLRGAKRGERLLDDRGSTCSALAEATSVTLALLLDRDLERPPETAAPREPAAPATQTDRGLGTMGRLSVLAGPAIGFVPLTSLGVGAAVELQQGPVSVGIAGRHVVAQSTPFGPGSVRVALTMADARICGWLPLSGPALRTALCAHGAGGRLAGEGAGYDTSSDATLLWLAAGAGAGLGGTLGTRWHWGLGTSIFFPLRKQTFSVQNAGVAYETGRVGAAIDLELGVRIF
jgi:hypothetical protein